MLVPAALLAACSLRGPADIELAPRTHLKLSRELVVVAPDEAGKLMRSLGERPGAPVLGAVLTTDETPRMMVLYDGGRDARGKPRVDLVGWYEAPLARSLVRERILARARN
jgi:uncharacterized membrane-anchored protein